MRTQRTETQTHRHTGRQQTQTQAQAHNRPRHTGRPTLTAQLLIRRPRHWWATHNDGTESARGTRRAASVSVDAHRACPLSVEPAGVPFSLTLTRTSPGHAQ
eukprot:scaffold33711_cov43-Phaeocystis_antarctica.AAC.1